MSRPTLVLSIRRTLATLAAAGRAASAVETHLVPRRQDLKTLGIDEAAFRRIAG